MSNSSDQDGGQEQTGLPRNPLLINRDDTALLIVDVQEKLMPLVINAARVVWNCGRLIDACEILNVPSAATEQYPKGLGPTVPELARRFAKRPEKLTFSCGSCGDLFGTWQDAGVQKILVAGIETHVCIQQTVLDLLAAGFGVFVAVDAVTARFTIDHETALRRMDSVGATLTTAESAIFELCERAGTPEFKQLSQLVRQSPPS